MAKKIASGLFTLAIVGFFIFNRIPRYHQFDEGNFDIAPDEYYFYEIESTNVSPVKVQLMEIGTKTFDAYLMNESEFGKLDAWMSSDELEQPNINYMHRWESVSQVTHEDINIGKGLYYLVVDNTILGTDYEEGKELSVNYNLYEKY